MARHTVQLASTGDITAQLLVDGHDISNITTSVQLTVDARQERRMTVELSAFPVDVVLSNAQVDLDQRIHDFLVRLGWTPPPEEATHAIH